MSIPNPKDFRRTFTPIALTVLEVLVALGVIAFLAIEGYRAVKPPEAIAAERAVVLQKIETLQSTVVEIKKDTTENTRAIHGIEKDMAVIKDRLKVRGQ